MNWPLQDRERERVDEPLLDDALERPRAIGRIVAEVAQEGAGVVGQFEGQLALADAVDHALHLKVDDLADLRARERRELHDVVQAVDELRFEARLDPGAAAGDV